MPKFTFNLPDIGEGIAEAEIVAWHVKVGDIISEDQPLADMMTDKATVEMESPVSGVVTKVAGEAGDVIAIGAMLVEIEVAGDSGNEAEKPVKEPILAVVEDESPHMPEPVSIAEVTPPPVAPPPVAPTAMQHVQLHMRLLPARTLHLMQCILTCSFCSLVVWPGWIRAVSARLSAW
jgi:2-oxoisovalerate dehydrogenase E2 component (dihydrolipoyl transacylase)